MSDAMLSIVRHLNQPGDMLVRARLAGDIEHVFPAAAVTVGGGTDYRFRATLPESDLVKAVSRRLLDINYGNFKSSAHEPKRHNAYVKVWDVMHRLQEAT